MLQDLNAVVSRSKMARSCAGCHLLVNLCNQPWRIQPKCQNEMIGIRPAILANSFIDVYWSDHTSKKQTPFFLVLLLLCPSVPSPHPWPSPRTRTQCSGVGWHFPSPRCTWVAEAVMRHWILSEMFFKLQVRNGEREMYAIMKLFDTCVGFLPIIRTFTLNLSQGGLQLAGACQ